MILQIKRVYDIVDENDGYRMLVDRLWPRGVNKQVAQIDEWNKNIAPSSDLRKWFGHKPENFREFSILYREELKSNSKEIQRIKLILEANNLSLIYAAKDPEINHAIILRDFILENL